MKAFATITFLLLCQLSYGQFYFGANAVAGFSTQKVNDMDYSKGFNLNSGYSITKSISTQVNFERQYIVSFKEKNLLDLIYADVMYSPTEWSIKPFAGLSAGYARERFDLPLDFGIMTDDGWLFSLFAGISSHSGIIDNLMFDFRLSYDQVLIEQDKSLIKASIGLRYVL
ncbi:MAG: hypothetical protein K0B15_12780 [Lentimicrobium sp.]|nr:hypothetical protein [Lentimicrobium sp.]